MLQSGLASRPVCRGQAFFDGQFYHFSLSQFHAAHQLPADPLLVGTVLSHNTDGTSTLQSPEGGTMRARGTGVGVGLKAFVRGGVVEGTAPDLPDYSVDV